MIRYILDFTYGATKYPNALIKTKVYKGYFHTSPRSREQKLFFEALMASGFKRTFWQLVFPGQVAGIVKKLSATSGPNEYHVRFYEDGGIECELEYSRWSSLHWSNRREFGEKGVMILHSLLEECVLIEEEIKEEIRQLFTYKGFTPSCIRQL